MSYHYCEILLDRATQSVVRLQVEKYWCRHDIVMHCIRRSYITREEAEKICDLKRRWSRYKIQGYIPLDKTPYIYKEFIDSYASRGAT
jgi:hypothetical protein